MSASDSIFIGPLTASWQNLWELCNAKYIADGIPSFEKFARTLNMEAPKTNLVDVEWSRTSIGNNPAGVIEPGNSVHRSSGDYLVNENLYTIYVRGDGASLYVERTQ